MTITITRHPITDHDAWLALRRDDVTASDVAALLGPGLHRYTTPRMISATKRGEVDDLDSSTLRRGRVLEPAVAQAIADDHGLRLTYDQYYLRMRSSEDPDLRLGATCDYHACPWPDQLADALGEAMPLAWRGVAFPLHIVFELKSVRYNAADRWAQGLPMMYRVQALAQAMLSNANGAVVAALFDDFDLTLRLYPVERDPAMEAAIRAGVSGFWRRERLGEEHPMHLRDNPAHRWPGSDPSKTVDLMGHSAGAQDVDWIERLDRREEARIAAKVAKAEQARQEEIVEEIDHSLKVIMQEAEAATAGPYSVTWKTGKRSRALRVKKKT